MSAPWSSLDSIWDDSSYAVAVAAHAVNRVSAAQPLAAVRRLVWWCGPLNVVTRRLTTFTMKYGMMCLWVGGRQERRRRRWRGLRRASQLPPSPTVATDAAMV